MMLPVLSSINQFKTITCLVFYSVQLGHDCIGLNSVDVIIYESETMCFKTLDRGCYITLQSVLYVSTYTILNLKFISYFLNYIRHLGSLGNLLLNILPVS